MMKNLHEFLKIRANLYFFSIFYKNLSKSILFFYTQICKNFLNFLVEGYKKKKTKNKIFSKLCYKKVTNF